MAKKQSITLTDLVTQNPNLKASLQKFEGVKQQLDERAKQCLLIKVTDEASLNICEQNLVKMNELVSAVEEVHKSEKAPHWENCKAIDAAKNYILDFDVDPIKHLKDEKVAWIKLNDNYKYFIQGCEKFYSDLDCVEKCDNFTSLLDKPLTKGMWKSFESNVISEIDKYKRLVEIKKEELLALENATPDEAEAIIQNAEEAKANIESAAVIESTPTEVIKKVRKTWKFEVVDASMVPLHFLCVDEDKVKEFMKSKVDTLKDGEVITGIKFYQEISVTV